MKEHRFRVWHLKEKKMYFRGYQKFLHALLCDDDHGGNEGRGIPVKRASYGDCVFLESTDLFDKHQKEIFEGDRVRVKAGEKVFEEFVGPVPDTFGVKVHPLQALFKKQGFAVMPEKFEIEIIGDEYRIS